MRSIPPLLTLAMACSAGLPGQAHQSLDLAQQAQSTGDLATAARLYGKFLEKNPGRADVRVRLGEVLEGQGDFDQAIEQEQRAILDGATGPGVQMDLGQAYYRKGDLNRARAQFDAVYVSHPDDLAATLMLAYTFNKLGREADAARLLEPIEAQNEGNLDLKYALGYALIQIGRAPEGIARMEKVAAERGSADAWVIAGSAHLYRKEFKEARTDLDKAQVTKPDLPGIQTLAGQAEFGVGDREAASASFKKALRNDPRDFTANLYLGIMRLDERDLESAKALLTLALELQPSSPLARLQVGRLAGMEGNYDDAVRRMEELEKSDPEWLDPHVELAALYYKMHRPGDGAKEREIVQRLESKEQQSGPRQK